MDPVSAHFDNLEHRGRRRGVSYVADGAIALWATI